MTLTSDVASSTTEAVNSGAKARASPNSAARCSRPTRMSVRQRGRRFRSVNFVVSFKPGSLIQRLQRSKRQTVRDADA